MTSLDDIRAERARRSLPEFIKQAWPVIEPGTAYLHNWHIDAICEYLTAVRKGQILRLIINIPPRYMKSIIVSVMWPVWTWIDWPESRWLFASYSQDLSTMHSLNRRLIVESPWYRRNWNIELSSDHNIKTEFSNSRRGIMTATSIGGTATGKGGDGIVFDDPHNPKSADSEVERKTTVRDFHSTFSTRLNDKKKGFIVGVMQRLNVADLSGECIEQGYEHLCLPGIAKAKTTIVLPSGRFIEYDNVVRLPSGREIVCEVGAALWPEREGIDDHQRMKRALGSYGYAGQYDQTPSPDGGGKFRRDWFRYFDDSGHNYILHRPEMPDERVLKSECVVFQTADLAMGEKQDNDYTVIATWAITPKAELLLLDVQRLKKEAPEVKAALKAAMVRWKPQFQGIEKAHYGAAVCQEWLRIGFPLMQLIADKDKITRSLTVGLAMENGRVYFLANAEWLIDYESELLLFPNAPHDDQVDVTSYAGLILSERAMSTAEAVEIDLGAENQRTF